MGQILVYKNAQNLLQKQMTQFKNEQKIWTDTSPENIRMANNHMKKKKKLNIISY